MPQEALTSPEGRKIFTSRLENENGEHESISIRLDAEGKPPIIVFEDIDKTLLHLEPTYSEIRKAMWPEAVEKDGMEAFSKVHLAGYQLGTMWRELYRIHGIYSLGKEEWRDAEIYEREFLAPGKDGEHVDEAGDPHHELADALLEKFDILAAETIERQAKENPELLEKAKIGPMYKLNMMYKRLGIPIVGMSANPRRFIEAVCKHTGLSSQFLDCATDTDVTGLKEHKMQWLIERLKEKGMIIPYDRLMVVGDSPMGDVGSASRFQSLVQDEHPEVTANGIVIIEGEKDMQAAIQKLAEINDIDVHTFDYKEAEKLGSKFYSKDRGKFYSQIKKRQ